MIIIHSELKKLLPSLKVETKQLALDFAMIGHFCASCRETEGETVYDLEIKAANRADCLGYIGIARDLSALYDLELVLPTVETLHATSLQKQDLDIKISAPHLVQTLRAQKLSNLKIGDSPVWLQKVLRLSDINPRNNLIDLTNYIMLLWGIPAHAFDAIKTKNNLDWTESTKGETISTFDGTQLKLQEGNLTIKSNNIPASMSSVGGANSGIDSTTTETIVEVAVYDPVRVHKDNRALLIQTEAGNRLEKFLSPTVVEPALLHLVSLIQETCGGQVCSDLFKFDNFKSNSKTIKFDPELPTKYAGTKIPADFALKTLQKLGCTLNPDNTITTPEYRTDLNYEEDLIDDVIRMYGYYKIPTNQPIYKEIKNDITPKIIKLSESIKNILVELGYDEVRSWPVIKTENKLTDYCKLPYIETENSMNEEYFTLRQSVTESLVLQKDIYDRYKVKSSKFFEIGKVFYKKNNTFVELHSLAIHTNNSEDLETLCQKLNIKNNFQKYQDFYELNLSEISDFTEYKKDLPDTPAYELTTQLTELDANKSFSEKQNPEDLLKEYLKKINKEILWSLTIKDYYHDQKTGEHKYTFTATYFNCDNATAVTEHLQAFDLQ